MKSTKNSIAELLAVVAVFFLSPVAGKETKTDIVSPVLYKEIARQDSMMFAAFNAQDLPGFKAFFARDLEWFQDNAGFMRYDSVFINFENNFNKGLELTRRLVKGSMEVYPVKDYGAIESGVHMFMHIENGKQITGTFKFLAVWKQEADDKWVITRMVSYDH